MTKIGGGGVDSSGIPTTIVLWPEQSAPVPALPMCECPEFSAREIPSPCPHHTDDVPADARWRVGEDDDPDHIDIALCNRCAVDWWRVCLAGGVSIRRIS